MKVYTERDQRIEAGVGDQFEIDLEGNPTSGYEWGVETEGGAIELDERDLVRTSVAIGAGSVERFRFRCTRSGTAVLRFALARSWESAPVKRHDIRVTIRG